MESPVKAITAALGLLTALVVLFGAITDQGWLPSFVKGPTQGAIPGQQPGESGDSDNGSQTLGGGPTAGGRTDGGRTDGSPIGGGPTGSEGPIGSFSTSRTDPLPPKPTAPQPTVDPETCVQGYVWREAIPGDRVCVTPQMRDEVRQDNQLADSRRSPTGGDYGPDTCLQGYVWREVVPSDHVCVTGMMRDQVRQDNALADSRRVG